MEDLGYYLREISKRGDRYGGSGGILDLLRWCGKPNTCSVTLEEARSFYERPDGKCRPEEGSGSAKPRTE